jgi:hypothetical protein
MALAPVADIDLRDSAAALVTLPEIELGLSLWLGPPGCRLDR